MKEGIRSNTVKIPFTTPTLAAAINPIGTARRNGTPAFCAKYMTKGASA
jgi:hypothetical protein